MTKVVIEDGSIKCVCGWFIILHDLNARTYHCDKCGFKWTELDQALEPKKIKGPEPARARSGADMERSIREEYEFYIKNNKEKAFQDEILRAKILEAIKERERLDAQKRQARYIDDMNDLEFYEFRQNRIKEGSKK